MTTTAQASALYWNQEALAAFRNGGADEIMRKFDAAISLLNSTARNCDIDETGYSHLLEAGAALQNVYGQLACVMPRTREQVRTDSEWKPDQTRNSGSGNVLPIEASFQESILEPDEPDVQHEQQAFVDYVKEIVSDNDLAECISNAAAELLYHIKRQGFERGWYAAAEFVRQGHTAKFLENGVE